MDKFKAQYEFWSGFGIPAFVELSAYDEEYPDDPFPYISYEPVMSDFDLSATVNASVWYRSTSWAEINEKVREISDYIGDMRTFSYDDGMMMVKKSTVNEFARPTASGFEDKQIKRILLTVEIEFV